MEIANVYFDFKNIYKHLFTHNRAQILAWYRKPSVVIFVYPEVKQKQQPKQPDHGSWAFNSGPLDSVYTPGIRVVLPTGSSFIHSNKH